MSELDNAMLQHIKYLVLVERWPFCYKDFLNFEVNGIKYNMSHGTFRNKILSLKKLGMVEVCFPSFMTYYTIKGVPLSRKIREHHTGVRNNIFYKMVGNLPLNDRSIHDIRLRFRVTNFWNFLEINTNYPQVQRSKDIIVPPWNEENANIKILVHKSDVVSVIISCTLTPIPLNADGIIFFFNLLVRVEEKLKNLLEKFQDTSPEKTGWIRPYHSWKVTMWHFGRDSFTEYAGEKFSITVGDAQRVLTRMYAKDIGKGKKRIRLECQEYPNMSLEEAIQERLYNNKQTF